MHKKILIISIISVFITACVSQPNFERIRGNNQIMHQAGVSFLPPSHNLWGIVKQHTYQTMLFIKNDKSQETLITVVDTFNMPKLENGISFLS